jgi:hypothetical protein
MKHRCVSRPKFRFASSPKLLELAQLPKHTARRNDLAVGPGVITALCGGDDVHATLTV